MPSEAQGEDVDFTGRGILVEAPHAYTDRVGMGVCGFRVYGLGFRVSGLGFRV